MLEFNKRNLVYDKEGVLEEMHKEYIDVKCNSASKQFTVDNLLNFRLDDLVIGKDVSIDRNLPSERYFVSVVNAKTGEAYFGCTHYLKVSRPGYMATKLDLEFAKETECDLSLVKTQNWIEGLGDKSVVRISKDMNAKTCVVSVYKVEKVSK